MLLTILKVIVALYGATKLLGAKGASKEFFDTLDFRTNKFLISLKDEEVNNVLWALYGALFKLNVGLVVIFVGLTFLFKPMPSVLVINWMSVFCVSFLFTVSIPWILDHARYIEKHFFSSPVIFIPLFPLAGLALELVYSIDILGPLKSVEPFTSLNDSVEGNHWKFSLYLSGIFFVLYVIVPYLLFWLILLPIFYFLMLFIKLSQSILGMAHKHMNENILAVIMGVAAVVLAGM